MDQEEIVKESPDTHIQRSSDFAVLKTGSTFRGGATETLGSHFMHLAIRRSFATSSASEHSAQKVVTDDDAHR